MPSEPERKVAPITIDAKMKTLGVEVGSVVVLYDAGGIGEVRIDGVTLKGCTEVELFIRVGEPPRCYLTVQP